MLALAARPNRSFISRLALITLSVIPVPAFAGPDDHANTCQSATPWVLARSNYAVTGTLETSGDVDAFELRLEPGALYRFNRWIGDCLTCPRARIFNPAAGCERSVAGIDGLDFNQPIGRDWFLAPADGRMFMLVDYPTGGYGDYRVRIDRIAGPLTDDFPGGVDDPSLAAPDGRIIRGSLEFGLDQDTFVVNARPGALYRLEAVEGFGGVGGGADVIATFGPLFREGKPLLQARLPEPDCFARPEGCGSTRMIAPVGEDDSPQLFITIRRDNFEEPDRPAATYAFRVIDEGDFVPLPAGQDCPTAPAAPIGVPIAVELSADPLFPVSLWSLPADVPGHVYRISVRAMIGAASFWFGATDSECGESLAFEDSLSTRRTYFRAADSLPKRLFVTRNGIRRDFFNLPIPGWCIVQVDDLGPILDPEAPDTPISPGGRIFRGGLDFGGDEDTFVTQLEPGADGSASYRIELRVLTPGSRVAGLVAFTPQTALSFAAIGPESSSPVPAFTSRTVTVNQTTPVHIRLDRRDEAEETPTVYQIRVYRAGCRADWDGSTAISLDDLYAYLGDYLAGDGEFDGLGASPSVGDLLSFIQSYFAGCN